MSELRVSTGADGPFTVLALHGDLDDTTAGSAEAHVLKAVVGGPAHLVLDLSGVGFLTSAGINLVAKTHFAVRTSRGSLRLVVPEGGGPERVLRFTGITEAVDTYPTLEQALLPPVPEWRGLPEAEPESWE
ncbi:STAS domain-containing protein [Actinocorallia longicatena]|uniref:STAS domain-containing protein n=1 Tax=Actinocorallia longicatena TaxID=111803 RepID=A0ABP6QEL0_9ACTN